jgi:tetratricopeptide (TPR) repeat protein
MVYFLRVLLCQRIVDACLYKKHEVAFQWSRGALDLDSEDPLFRWVDDYVHASYYLDRDDFKRFNYFLIRLQSLSLSEFENDLRYLNCIRKCKHCLRYDKYQAAFTFANRASHIYSHSIEAQRLRHYCAAWLLLKDDQLDEAIRFSGKSLAIEPGHQAGRFLRDYLSAVKYLDLGYLGLASRYCKQALLLKPAYLPTIQMLMTIFLAQKDYVSAQDLGVRVASLLKNRCEKIRLFMDKKALLVSKNQRQEVQYHKVSFCMAQLQAIQTLYKSMCVVRSHLKCDSDELGIPGRFHLELQLLNRGLSQADHRLSRLINMQQLKRRSIDARRPQPSGSSRCRFTHKARGAVGEASLARAGQASLSHGY